MTQRGIMRQGRQNPRRQNQHQVQLNQAVRQKAVPQPVQADR